MAEQVDAAMLLREFEGVDLRDKRLNARLQRILKQIALSPGDSFPDQMESDADQEALYRFLSNKKISMDGILAGHQRQTLERVAREKLVRILHDTSEFCFEGEREGLGVLRRDQKGFLGHFSLAVDATESRVPLGILSVDAFINADVLENRQLTTAQKTASKRAKTRDEKKSSRWERCARHVATLLPKGVDAIHVMDQEADDYSVFSTLLEGGQRFVIRADAQRFMADGIRIGAALESVPSQIFRNVPLTARSKKQATRQHPTRAERMATLEAHWSTVTLRRPSSAATDTLPELTLRAVHIFEPSPPDGETPIDWMLLTTETIESFDDVAVIVDHYRARWIIEEYFKALKTGCAIEKRQLCSLNGLLNALAIFVPMAWTLLVLRRLGRDPTPRPASTVFNDEQVLLLRALLKRRGRRFVPDTTKPTVRDVMLGIAALGGHIKNNGDPGWLVLGRGMRRFSEAEEGWQAMRTYDQS
jgi:hypothetical protein